MSRGKKWELILCFIVMAIMVAAVIAAILLA